MTARHRAPVGTIAPRGRHRAPDPRQPPALRRTSVIAGTSAALLLTGTVAHLRGYRSEWLVWTLFLPAAAATGGLRMIADKHYLTDVLTGAALGAGLGWALPALFHPRRSRAEAPGLQVRLGPAPGGAAAAWRHRTGV